MSRQYLCDLCRMDVALENQLIPIKFGEDQVAEVCYNCASVLKTGLKKQVADIKASPMEQPAAPEPTAPAPNPAVGQTAQEPTPGPKAPGPAQTQ